MEITSTVLDHASAHPGENFDLKRDDDFYCMTAQNFSRPIPLRSA